MPVYLDSKTKRLFIKFTYKGDTVKRRLPEGMSRTDAAKLETKLKHEAFFDSHGLTDKAEVPVWERFVEDVYLEHVAANNSEGSLDKAIVICKAATKHFRGMAINQIKPADVERFKVERQNTQTRHGHRRKPATIHREMSIISRVFSLAVRNDHCFYNPCSRIDLPRFDNVQDAVLEMHQADLFFASFRNSLQRDIATVVIFTGLRQKDILGLEKKHVRMDANEIVTIQGKTQRRVRVPMNGVVRAIMEKRYELDGDLLFPSYRTGEQLKSIKNGIAFACQRAGLPKLGIRDLRRTFGTWLHELGYDDSTVASLLGHTDLRSVPRYKRGTEIKRTAVNDLEQIRARNVPPLDLTKMDETASLIKSMVEMRGIEPLTSALRTDLPALKIH
jgi:integrase